MRTAKIGPDVRLLVTRKSYQPSRRVLKSCYAANLKRETQRQTYKPVLKTLDSGHHACKYAYKNSSSTMFTFKVPLVEYSVLSELVFHNLGTVTSSSPGKILTSDLALKRSQKWKWRQTTQREEQEWVSSSFSRHPTGINLLTGFWNLFEGNATIISVMPLHSHQHVKLKQVLLKT